MAQVTPTLGAAVIGSARRDSSQWFVIDPDVQEWLDDATRIGSAPPGVVWIPTGQFRAQPDLTLYDRVDGYDWAAADVWDVWHGNPLSYRAIRVAATGETVGGVSQYAVVQERLLRDWIIDPASREYSRLHEVACLYGAGAYVPDQVGEYGSGGYSDAGSEASRAVDVLHNVDGFSWLYCHWECTGTTDPYFALAVRPHIGQLIDQQSYDALRRGFEEQHGELLHPDDQPLADIRYKPA
ncbi:Uncharacterised protein [Mycobacteroides abscessus subsp. abscessus]|uniref:hypothetical protein n=1 Tax=Mycobacteroides abscessus TaxID=36809 RepID=UPI00092A203A|nr:hypothetical protein [Mycobacteroides abscessus]SIH19794.1 Uncharacterised protein [Mycobacteroides abscessus subsp. abscessus]